MADPAQADPQSLLANSAQFRADNPKTPTPTMPPMTVVKPGTSAGTGALPPSAGSPATPLAGESASSPSFTVTGDGEAYVNDLDRGPQKLFTVKLPPEDAKHILKASGARYDEKLDNYDNVPEATVKALAQGRPSPTEYWKSQWAASEAEAVRAFNALQFLDGKKTREQLLSDNHLPTLQMQLADRPEMAWFGKGGILSDFLKHPGDAMERAAESAVGSGISQVEPILSVAKEALVGAGLGGAAALPLAANVGALSSMAPPVAGVAAAATVAGGATLGAQAGAMHALYKMGAGRAAAHWADQGVPDDVIRKHAPVAGALSAALLVGGFPAMTQLGKAAFIDGLAASATAKRAMAHWLVESGAMGGVMAAQAAVDHFLQNLVAEAAHQPELLEDAKTALDNILAAGMGGMAFGGALASIGLLKEGLSSLTPEERNSPEGKKVAASVKRAEEPSVHEAVTRKLTVPLAEQEPEASPASDQSPEPKPEGSPAQSRGASEPSSPDSQPAPTSASASSSSASERSLAGPAEPSKDAGIDYGSKLTSVAGLHEALRRAEEGTLSPRAIKLIKEKLPRFLELHERQLVEREADGLSNERITPIVEAQRELLDRIEKGPIVPVSLNADEESKGPAGPRKFFTERPLDLRAMTDDTSTARDARQRFVGGRNEQITKINQFAESVKRAVPDKPTQLAMRWYAEADGDQALLSKWAAEPKLEPYRAEIEAAMSLPAAAQEQVARGKEFFAEAGVAAKEAGVFKEGRENYLLNHVYLPDEPTDFVKTEMGGGMRPSTGHALLRVFNTLADAVIAGKKIAPVGYADLLGLYGSEMSRAITTRNFLSAMSDVGLGGWKAEAPAGWSQVGTLERDIPVTGSDGNPAIARHRFYAPDGIAKGLRAVTDPDYMRLVDSARATAKYQAFVKTVDLSLSLYHDVSLLAAALNEGQYETLISLPHVEEKLASPEWQAREQDAALHNVTTTATSPNMDYVKDISAQTESKDLIERAKSVPGVKQGLELSDKHARLLFDKWQRYMKVNDFTRLAGNWIADHPAATAEEIRAAKLDIASHVNNTFGGQNWEAMGLPKSELTRLRSALLAPDWFVSNAKFIMDAIRPSLDPSSMAAKKNLVRAAIYGTLAAEIANVAATGHTMGGNAEGHKLEAQVAPHVYFSTFRGGPGELLKLGSMIAESGWNAPGRYAQGRAGPFARTIVGLLSRVKYNGQPIIPPRKPSEPHENPETGRTVHTEPTTSVDHFLALSSFILGSAGPAPFAVSNLYDYVKSGEATPVGTLFVASGLGRYSVPPKPKKSSSGPKLPE